MRMGMILIMPLPQMLQMTMTTMATRAINQLEEQLRLSIESIKERQEWELINKYYRRPLAGEECKFLTATDILERINASVKERLSVIRVGNALLSMGYERTRAGNLRGYRVVEIPYADIERKQKDMGKFTDTPNEDTALKGEEDMQPELPF